MSLLPKITGKRSPLQEISPNSSKRRRNPLTDLVNGIANKQIEQLKKLFTSNPQLFTSDRYLERISLFSLLHYSEPIFLFLADKHPDKEVFLKHAIIEGHKEAVTLLFRVYPDLEEEVFSWVDEQEIRLIKQLVRMGIFPKSSDGETLLHHAALIGKYPLFSFLLEHKFDISQPDNLGRTPIVFAIMGGNLAIVRVSHKETDIAKRFGGNELPLLQTAILSGNIGAVKQLIYEGHNPKDVNGKNQNSLEIAAREGKVEIMEELIQRGMLPRPTGHSETHIAAQQGNIKILRLLNRYGFIQLHRDHEGNTPVDLLVQNREISTEVVEFFDQKGASFVSLDSNGTTPFHVAASLNNYNVLQYFFYFENQTSQILTALGEREVKGKPFRENRLTRVRDINGNTLFHSAAEKGYKPLLKDLFQLYPHFVQTRNYEGKLPAEVALDDRVMSLLIQQEDEVEK